MSWWNENEKYSQTYKMVYILSPMLLEVFFDITAVKLLSIFDQFSLYYI